MSQETCPWCQTDIIWDEEIGREESCPHCYNELEEYRSIKISSNSEEKEKTEPFIPIDESDINDEKLDQDVEQLIEEVEEPLYELEKFESEVEAFRSSQEETLACMQCHEEMIFTGRQIVENQGYTSVIPEALLKPFLRTPYTIHVYVCPDCFEIRTILSQEDRLKLME